ncbi:hypothetical protein BDW62DRAFT_212532 [Aspergillus aurantiobrunneus]
MLASQGYLTLSILSTEGFFPFFPPGVLVTVCEYEDYYDENKKPAKRISTSAVFQVERERLSASDHFRTMLRGSWRESTTELITLHEDKILAMEILFNGLHDTLGSIASTKVLMATVWYLILACDKYEVEFREGPLKAWFIGWYKQEKINPDFERQVLYPCYEFDYAPGFQEVTRYFAYHSKYHIMEHKPIDLFVLHLPQRVIQQLNAARGRLRNVLHNGLFDHITVFDHFRELERIKVWPLENTMKKKASINDILTNLKQFDSSRIRAPGTGTTSNGNQCTLNPGQGVFDGLCLDCMSVTKTLQEGRDPDHEYWQNCEKSIWDLYCRINHGEPTYITDIQQL